MVLPTLTAAEVSYEVRHRWDTKQEWLYATMTIPLLFAMAAVAMRLYARRMRGISLAWNDHLVVLSLLLTMGMTAAFFRATHFGLGSHIVVVGKIKAYEVAKMLYVGEVLFPLAGSTARLSVLLLYRTIFGTRERWFDIGVKSLAGLWIALAIVGFFCTLLQCVPVHLAWTSNHSVGCLDLERMILGLTIAAIFLNFATLLLPLPLVWKLHMSFTKKFAVGVLFVLGGGDVVINTLRAFKTHEVSTYLVDFTWLQCTSVMLGVLEVTLAIICVCIPTLRPLFVKLSNSIAHQAQRAQIGRTTWTVPFVMLKSMSRGPGRDPYRLSSEYGDIDEEKLVESSSPNSGDPNPKPPRKDSGKFTSIKSALFRRSGNENNVTNNTWPSNQSTLNDGDQDATNPWKQDLERAREHDTEALIAQSLVQSGYEKAFHPPASAQFKPKFLDEDPLPTATPANSRKTSRDVRRTLRSILISLDTRDEVVRAPSRGKRQKNSAPTGTSSATLLNSPNSPPQTKTPLNDLAHQLSRSSTGKSGKRKPAVARPEPPVLLPSRYQPPTPQTKPSTTPTSSRSKNSSQKKKGPRYVKSPMSDPDEKVRIGSPREVHIRRPSSSRSIKDPSQRPNIKPTPSALDLNNEPPVPKLHHPHSPVPAQSPLLPPPISHSPRPPTRGSPRPSNLPPLHTQISDLSIDHAKLEPHYQREYTISPDNNELRVTTAADVSDYDMSPASAIPSPLKSRQDSRDELRQGLRSRSDHNLGGNGGFADENGRKAAGGGGAGGKGGTGSRERLREVEEAEYARIEKEKERELRSREKERWYIDPVGGPRKKPHPPQYQSPPQPAPPSHSEVGRGSPLLRQQAHHQQERTASRDRGEATGKRRERGWERQRRKDVERARMQEEREMAERAGREKVRDWIERGGQRADDGAVSFGTPAPAAAKVEKPLPPLPPKGQDRDSDAWF